MLRHTLFFTTRIKRPQLIFILKWTFSFPISIDACLYILLRFLPLHIKTAIFVIKYYSQKNKQTRFDVE